MIKSQAENNLVLGYDLVVEINYKKIFFVGIGGIGVSALARMMHARGVSVSGSDITESEITEEIRKLGIPVSIGQSLDLIPQDADLIVYTNALKRYDPEFFSSLTPLPSTLISYPELLGEVSAGMKTIAVAGTHGKTTTTGMIATMLIDFALDPTVVIGSLLLREKTNFIQGKSDYFVTEADEYQRAFHALYPTILIITNIDLDHLDYYKDLADIQNAFRELALRVPENGAIVCNPSHLHVAPALVEVKAKIIDYTKEDTTRLSLRFPGAHNIENAQVALGVARILNLDLTRAIKSLNEFKGTWRRFEYKGETKNGALVYNDYAHNPQKVRAALAGAREKYPDRRIVAVFQPHLYSRTKSLLNEFTQSFGDADEVILVPVFAARELDDGTVSSQLLAEAITRNDRPVRNLSSFEILENYINDTTGAGDIIILLGAGDIYKVAEKLIKPSI